MPRSFPPVVAPGAKVLILGSMPGAASLKKKQYYAHPQNQFWRLLGEVLGKDLPLMTYEDRLAVLKSSGVALWDVLAACEREGSLDADIEDEEPNRVAELLRETEIKIVFLNGGKAESAFKAFIAESLPAGVSFARLPSSSPAHAGLTYAEKLDAWRAIGEAL
ncbi:MAG: DNA-deoxyinosine glycosylase [Elusimicrobia bacterium]|nr:DNA-deoxyinosine glycosylase [Elusimicrobiota bacterium]